MKNTESRISKLEKRMGDDRPSEELGVPIIPLSPEQKAKWPKGLPYPILGGLSVSTVYGMQKDTTK